MSDDTADQGFVHLRHLPFSQLEEGAELLLVCPQFRSNVNLSRIARAAGCCGVKRIVMEGKSKVDPKIARDSSEHIQFENRRSIPPVLKKLKTEGYTLVGLEQTTHSNSIYQFEFPRKCALVIGNERNGITEEILSLLDLTVEIPVYGLPHSHNVASATTIAMYEFCRQFHAKNRT